jgi:hypothetical protein
MSETERASSPLEKEFIVYLTFNPHNALLALHRRAALFDIGVPGNRRNVARQQDPKNLLSGTTLYDGLHPTSSGVTHE